MVVNGPFHLSSRRPHLPAARGGRSGPRAGFSRVATKALLAARSAPSRHGWESSAGAAGRGGSGGQAEIGARQSSEPEVPDTSWVQTILR